MSARLAAGGAAAGDRSTAEDGRDTAELPVWATLATAATAAAAASWLTNPLDLAKLRLQVRCCAAACACGLSICSFRARGRGEAVDCTVGYLFSTVPILLFFLSVDFSFLNRFLVPCHDCAC